MSKTLLYGATKVDEGNEAYSAIASLEQFQWRNRVLVIFADKGNARAARQENQLLADRDALQDRDMVILKIVGGSVRELFGAGEKLDAAAIARDLGDPTAGEFAAFLVGKDGNGKAQGERAGHQRRTVCDHRQHAGARCRSCGREAADERRI